MLYFEATDNTGCICPLNSSGIPENEEDPMDALFLLNSALLGVGLAMDAFSVSMADGLNDAGMPKSKMVLIAGTFAFFQYLMPMIGWICVHTIVSTFKSFDRWIPWIALALLVYIGGNMIHEGLHPDDEISGGEKLTLHLLILQGIATSIDALSVGFTIADYGLAQALICGLIIGAVTFIICMFGLLLGRKFASRLAGKASILGGVILIVIGLEIFIKGVL